MEKRLFLFIGILVFCQCPFKIDFGNILDMQNLLSNSTIIKDMLDNPQKFAKDGLAEFLMNNKDLLTDPKMLEIYPFIIKLIDGKTSLSDLGQLYEKLGKSLLEIDEKDKEKYKNLIKFVRNFLSKNGFICGPYARSVNQTDLTEVEQQIIQKEAELLKSYLSILQKSNNAKLINIYNNVFSMAINKDPSKYPDYIDSIEKEFQTLNMTKNATLTQEERNSLKNVEKFIKRMKYMCKDEKNILNNTSFYGEHTNAHINNTGPLSPDDYLYNRSFNPAPSTYPFQNWTSNNSHNYHYQECIPYECSGCCRQGVCRPEEECHYVRPERGIFAFIVSLVICCCCCMCFWWGLGYLILRLRRRLGFSRQTDENGREMPVTGIPVNNTNVAQGIVEIEPNTSSSGNPYSNLNSTENSYRDKI